MGKPRRNIAAAAEETTTPPDELTADQVIARVVKAEGNSLYTCALPNQKTVLVELEQRFRNTIWIKRGGFVLVDRTPNEERAKANSKLDGEIINVVRDEKAWRKMPYWCAFSPNAVLSHCERFVASLLMTCQHTGPRNSQRSLTKTTKT